MDTETEKGATAVDSTGIEKSVNIRFANYSALTRAGEVSSLFGSHLMALIGGFMSGRGGDSSLTDNLIDRSEEAMLKSCPLTE